MAANRLTYLCITLCITSTTYTYAGMDRFWSFFKDHDDPIEQFDGCENLSKEQQQHLIKTFQTIRNDEQQLDLKKRMEWFCQLADTEQERMRAAWQNMSTHDRNKLKKKLQSANTADERQEIRQEIIEKYSSVSN